MPRNKKIKGGIFTLSIDYIEDVKDISTLNNLKSRDDLFRDGYLDENGFILNEDGSIMEDPFNLSPIKYEDAILINDLIYHIKTLYDILNEKKDNNDFNNEQIAFIDVEKIYLKIMMSSNNPNNLKSFDELNSLKRIIKKDNKYYLTYYNGIIIKDPYSKKPIEYKDAFLLDGVIYDVISLYNEIIKTANFPDEENMKKIKLMIPYDKKIEDLNDKINNLKSLEILKRLGYIDDENYFINDFKRRVTDPYIDRPIKYENAILIDGKLYNVKSIFANLFLKPNDEIKNISVEDIKKIRLNYYNQFEIYEDKYGYNNLKPKLYLKHLEIIDDDDYFINTTDPITKNLIKYENAIFINGYIYDISSIDKFIQNQSDEIKKDYYGIEILKEDIEKINLKKIIMSIKDTSNYNNLKGFDELNSMENILNSNKEFENIRDLFTNKRVHYDKAILINDNIYNIISIYEFIKFNEKLSLNLIFTVEDIKKIKLMVFFLQISNIRDPNKLISYQELKDRGLVDRYDFILDEDKQPIIDPYTDFKIIYQNAIIINNNLYDAISLFVANENKEEKVDYYNKKISRTDYNKVKDIHRELYKAEAVKPLKFNYVLNNYYKQIEKKIKNINSGNIENIYEFIYNLYLYIFNELTNYDYDNISSLSVIFNDIIMIMINYLRIVDRFENRIRLMDYPLEIIKLIFNTYFEKLNHINKNNIKKYYDLYLNLNYFIKYLDTTNLNTFLDFCLLLSIYFDNKNYNFFIEQQEAIKLNLLKKRVANELAKEFIGICENNNINHLMNFLDEIKKALSLPIISENEKILKILALHLIKKSLEIVKSNEPSVAIKFMKKSSEIAYKLSFKEDMKDIFEDVYNKHHHYLIQVLEKFNNNMYNINTIQTGTYKGIKFDKTKALEDARDKVKKEYDDFINNLLKAYKNILKIYMSSFMDNIDRSEIAKLEKNIDKCYKKAKQNFEVAEKTIETYDKIRPPTTKERVAKGISSIFRRKKVVPVEQSRSNVSPIESIHIPEPEIPSLSSLNPLPKRNENIPIQTLSSLKSLPRRKIK